MCTFVLFCWTKNKSKNKLQLKSFDYLQREFSVEERCELRAKLRAYQAVDDKVEGAVDHCEEAGDIIYDVGLPGDVEVVPALVAKFDSI